MHRNILGACLLGLSLLGCFAPVVFRDESLLTSPVTNGTLPEGPYGYRWHLPRGRHALDPAASAVTDEPWSRLIGSEVGQGRLPLWNPYNGFGSPLAANMQSGVFFPLKWVLFLTPNPWLWNFFLLCRLGLAGGFAYLFLRLFPLSMLSALIGAISFMLCGYLVLYVNMMHVNVEMLLPVAVYLTEVMIRRRTVGSVLVLGGALGLTVLGGMPESMLFLWLFTGLYFVARVGAIVSRPPHAGAAAARLCGLFAAAAALGLGLSAVLFVPFLEYASRAWTAHAEHAGLQGASAASAISLILPYFFNHLRAPWTEAGLLVIPYLGIAPLLLACLAWPARGRLSGIAVLCALYAVAGVLKTYGSPLVNWIGWLPPFTHAIFWKYNQLEITFAVSVLAAIGAHHLEGGKMSRSRVLLPCAIVVLVVIGFIALWWPAIVASATATKWVGRAVLTAAIVVVVAALALCWVQRAGAATRAYAMVAVVVLLLGELYAYIPKERPRKYDAGTPAPFVEFLKARVGHGEGRVYGLDSILFPNLSTAFRLEDARILEAMYIDRVRSFSRLMLGDTRHDRFTGMSSLDFNLTRAFDLSNVRFLLSRSDVSGRTLIPDAPRDGETTPDRGRRAWLWIDGLARPGLVERLPAEIARVLTVPRDGARLRFSVARALDPESWKRTEAMDLEIRVSSGGNEVSVFRRSLDPKNRIADRRWVEGEADLSPFRGHEIDLRLIARPDRSADRGEVAWGSLRLVEHGSLEAMPLIYDGEVKIYENRSALPRAFVVHRAEVIGDEPLILRRLRSDDFDPRRSVILEGQDIPPARLAGLKASASGESLTRIVRYVPDRVDIRVDTPEAGVLVFLDAYDPGWRATVNGAPRPIYRADFVFRAVFLDPGKSEITFVYSPTSFWVGLSISAGAAGVAVVALVWTRRRAGPRRS